MRVISLILSVYFTLASFIPRMDFSQLTHLDDIQRHYQEHLLQDVSSECSLSFTEFLYIHYINPQAHDKDQQEEHNHDHLPFLSYQYQFIAISTYGSERASPYSRETIYANTYQDPFHLTEFSSSIFHPPSCPQA